ncbi:Extradiol ring-cleavage dioxygenase, class III enzyme, subunit B [Lentinula boryana]|uniref:Extradiol ring-cleavage dioxygenase, class III enzyme, subunit B n=1 Tax=Lentinula boryana TaxID=40481 RepID=A0ABQ8Q1J0_9AGAR|nr:Extradiol ring-cleavage dioxygenase, class III enzyme, subunit B [Lentinula boryana]
MSSPLTQNVDVPLNHAEWRAALESLPSTPQKIPAFFFAHGSPALALAQMPARLRASGRSDFEQYQGPNGPLANFLRDFGPALLRKYSPKAIVVFSAHWETLGERLGIVILRALILHRYLNVLVIVTDYGEENPLLMDYYGFPQESYELKFQSRGDKQLSEQLVTLYKEAGQLARTTSKLEPRGSDGRGFEGPGLDHGVFVPFRLMFGEELALPVVQVSIDSSLSPEANWKLGKVVELLREEKVLVLAGGLPIHNLRDFSSFTPDTAQPIHHSFHKAILDALQVSNAQERKKAMLDLPQHPGFRACNPREEHFVPLYIAAGAAENENVKILNGLYGIPTVAFGV